MSTSIPCSGFLVIAPDTEDMMGRVLSAKFVKVTTRPPKLSNDERAIKVRFTIPRSVFEPIAEISAVIPEADVIAPEVIVG